MPSPVAPFYRESAAILERLAREGEVSSAAWFRSVVARALVLTAVSYFEVELTNAIEDAFRASLGDGPLFRFVTRRALERQFHTLFNWEAGRNANAFLSFFGEEFKKRVREALERGGDRDADEAFIEIGALRNRLAHRGFADFPLEKTAEELYVLSQRADLFLRVALDQIGALAGGREH